MVESILNIFLANQHSPRLSQYTLLLTLATIMDTHDPLTSEHSRKVGMYSFLIARELGLSNSNQSMLKLAGLLHHIGKVGIRKTLIYKPDRLSSKEMDEMKKHVIIGYEVVVEIPHLVNTAEAILYHHERLDGKGYPCGLTAEEIPLGARILSVADSFDAMVSSRLYKPTLSVRNALEELEICSNTQFDPKIVKALRYYFEDRNFRLPKETTY